LSIQIVKFWSVFRLVWIERMVYRVNFFLEILSGILSSLIVVFLWMAIYRYSGQRMDVSRISWKMVLGIS
jgi:ABC-type uncharacterized transport system permease subunit